MQGTHDIKLTDEQSAIAKPPWEPLFVMACPGAGKTTTIVQRFLNRARDLPPRQGIAVLSFTNVAAREIEEKSHEIGSSALTGFPNFVGTFDSFVNRFFVTPFGSPWSDKRPDILESWKRLDLRIRPRGVMSAKGLTLDELVPRLDGEANLDLRQVDPAIKPLVARELATWEREARRVRESLLKKGYLSCAEARIVALQRIRDECSSAALGGAMKARFVEIIVDEAQDCNDEDIEILRWLREKGISLVVVCDPDQAIYEFRGARLLQLDDLASGLRTLRMTQNWRSTPHICAMATTLRDEVERDHACGKYCDENLPVVLIDYEGQVASQIGGTFIECASKIGIAREEIVILAYGRGTAYRAAGRPRVDVGGDSGCLRLAQAVLTLRTDGLDARARLSAIEAVERLILKWFGVKGSRGLPKRICEEQGFDERWLRRAAYSILIGLPEPPGDLEHVQGWLTDLRQRTAYLGCPPGGAFQLKPGKLPRSPRTIWPMSAGTGATISAMTVHQAKGQEFDAVLFVLPRDGTKKRTSELLSAWENRENFEPKRVWYVAVTRARRLLGIAVPTAFAFRIRQRLESRKVPFETWHCDVVP